MQFTESKARLAERIQSSVKDTSSLIRQVIKSSKSTEVCVIASFITIKLTEFFCVFQLLVHSIKNLAATDASTETIDLSLKRSHALSNQMKLQLMQMRILEIDSTARKLENCLTRASKCISGADEPHEMSSDAAATTTIATTTTTTGLG